MGGSTAYPPLHTAEHLLTSLLFARFANVTAFRSRLKSRKAVLTFRCEDFPDESDRQTLERELRQCCAAGLPVSSRMMGRDEAEQTLPNMHQVPPAMAQIRAVRIGEPPRVADDRACVGQHVSTTAEIIAPRLPTLRAESEGGWRLTLVVG